MTERRRTEVHPLLQTRGVPGTHDVALLREAITVLQGADPVALPWCDRSEDDQLSRFVQHFERLTRRALAEMPDRADYLLRLNSVHQITWSGPCQSYL